MILQFEKCLELEGVSAIEPVGQVFDPKLHEAIDTVPVESEQDGLIVSVIETGYGLGAQAGDRPPVIIRPARVRVGKAG